MPPTGCFGFSYQLNHWTAYVSRDSAEFSGICGGRGAFGVAALVSSVGGRRRAFGRHGRISRYAKLGRLAAFRESDREKKTLTGGSPPEAHRRAWSFFLGGPNCACRVAGARRRLYTSPLFEAELSVPWAFPDLSAVLPRIRTVLSPPGFVTDQTRSGLGRRQWPGWWRLRQTANPIPHGGGIAAITTRAWTRPGPPSPSSVWEQHPPFVARGKAPRLLFRPLQPSSTLFAAGRPAMTLCLV